MARKRSAEQARIELRHFRMVNAPLIRERYPNVDAITISYSTAYDEAGGWEEKPELRQTYSPDAHVWFSYDCKNINCKGTLELGDFVSETISSGKTSGSGTYVCRHDVNRRGVCGVLYRFDVSVAYRR